MRQFNLILMLLLTTLFFIRTSASATPNVSWWHADNNPNDSVGSNHGTLTGVTYSAGKFGQAFDFDGSAAQYVAVPNSSSFDLLGTHSVSFWVYLKEKPAAGKYYYLVNKWKGGLEDKRVNIDSGGTLSYFLYGTTTANNGVTSTTPLTIGVWHHVAVTYDGSFMKIYINGAEAGSAAASQDVSDNDGGLYLGYNPGRSAEGFEVPFKGMLDEVGWYNRALTAEEVSANYLNLPVVTTTDVTAVTLYGATLNGTVNANGNSTAVSFDFGNSDTSVIGAYNNPVAATPTPVSGYTDTAVSADLSGLSCGLTYHYRVNGVNNGITASGVDKTFTTPACPRYNVFMDCNGGTYCGIINDGGNPYYQFTADPIWLSGSPRPFFEKIGYGFDRWNTKADGSGISYAPGDRFTVTEETTLYAQWLPYFPQPPGLVSWWKAERSAIDSVWDNNGSDNQMVTLYSKVGTAAFKCRGLPGDFYRQGKSYKGMVSSSSSSSFTMDFWAKLYDPADFQHIIDIPAETTSINNAIHVGGFTGDLSAGGLFSGAFPIHPSPQTGTTEASIGISLGSNAIVLFESSTDFSPTPLVYTRVPGDAPWDRWIHIAIVYENQTPRLYLNGVLKRIGLSTGRTVYPSSQLCGGVYNNLYDNKNGFFGYLDEVHILNRVLSPAEILGIYNAGGAGLAGTVVPVITDVTPAFGPASGGTVVTVSGNNFIALGAGLKFGSSDAAMFSFVSNTQMTATSPPGVIGQIADITVNTAIGASAISPVDEFAYITDQAKNVTKNVVYPLFVTALSNAVAKDEIRVFDLRFYGNFILDKGITLAGGYDSLFQTKGSSATLLIGSLSVAGGDAKVENIEVVGTLTVKGGSLRANVMKVR